MAAGQQREHLFKALTAWRRELLTFYRTRVSTKNVAYAAGLAREPAIPTTRGTAGGSGSQLSGIRPRLWVCQRLVQSCQPEASARSSVLAEIIIEASAVRW